MRSLASGDTRRSTTSGLPCRVMVSRIAFLYAAARAMPDCSMCASSLCSCSEGVLWIFAGCSLVVGADYARTIFISKNLGAYGLCSVKLHRRFRLTN